VTGSKQAGDKRRFGALRTADQPMPKKELVLVMTVHAIVIGVRDNDPYL
jgi:hypothetical protein